MSQWATDLKTSVTKTLAVKVGLFAFNDYWISNNYYLRIDNPGGTSGAIIPVDSTKPLRICERCKVSLFGNELKDAAVINIGRPDANAGRH